MSVLSEIQPKSRPLLINLVSSAGVNVDGWADFEGGAGRAASNPKYCYEWSFVEPEKVVVLCLWHASIQELNGSIVQNLNMREIAHQFERLPKGTLGKRRSLSMDRAIQTAFSNGLPVRVVVCEGKRRDFDSPESKASRVHKRLLDPVPWAVTSYDPGSGRCTLVRGALPDPFVDQFSFQPDPAAEAKRRDVSGQAFVRNPQVRRRVRCRARGKCEWCGEFGFLRADGKIYIETHHVIALAEGGLDSESNVVALCPNHHREAHHGTNRDAMREALLDYLSKAIGAEPGADTRTAGCTVRR